MHHESSRWATAPNQNAPPSTLRSAWARVTRELPSWLTSCVLHLAILILLALAVSIAPQGERLALETSFSSGESLAASGLDLGPPVEVAATQITELAPEAVELPRIESVDPAPTAGGAQALGDAPTGDDASGRDGEGLDLGLSSTSTGVFGLVEEARSFVYVFDRSESMNSTLSYSVEGRAMTITPLVAAKAELLRSLGDLNARQRFQILFYNHEPLLFEDRKLLAATAANKRRAAAFVTRLPGEGGTYHFAPLEAALALGPEAIFLMTDGQAQDDPTPAELDRIKLLNRKPTRINVIHFCFVPRQAGSLAELARDNGGQFISVNLSALAPKAGAGGEIDPNLARFNFPDQPEADE